MHKFLEYDFESINSKKQLKIFDKICLKHDRSLKYLCLNNDCQENKIFCSKKLENHQQHNQDLVNIHQIAQKNTLLITNKLKKYIQLEQGKFKIAIQKLDSKTRELFQKNAYSINSAYQASKESNTLCTQMKQQFQKETKKFYRECNSKMQIETLKKEQSEYKSLEKNLDSCCKKLQHYNDKLNNLVLEKNQ